MLVLLRNLRCALCGMMHSKRVTIRYVSFLFLIVGLANCDQQKRPQEKGTDSDDYSPVLKVSDEIEFQSAVTSKNDVYFVMFHIPWCDFCKQLESVFDELARHFSVHNSMDNPVIAAEVDCSKLSALCDRLNIESYPTLLLFNKGLDSPEKYEGPHSIGNLVNFTKEHLDSQSVGLRKPRELGREEFEAMDPTAIQFVMFYSPTCPHCRATFPEWRKLAATVNDDLKGFSISQVNCDVERELCANQEVFSLPAFILYKEGRMQDKYEGRDDLEAFTAYLISMRNELAKVVSSPKENDHDEAAVILTHKNIDKVMKSGFVFINFHKPWCHFCQALHPKWNQLAKELNRDSGSVTIASIDCTVQDKICNKYDIAGYPTMLLFHNGQRQMMYTGVHEFENLFQFVVQQTNKQKEL